MFFNRKYGITEKLEKIFWKKYYSESVIQDVEIPIDNCAKFLEFFNKEIGIKPIWVCPVMSYKKMKYDLYNLDGSKLYVNFGFWDIVKTKGEKENGYFNKKIEKKVKELNGKKSLYSTSYYDEKEFWELYNGKNYFKLKKKYDPCKIFPTLFLKAVKFK